MGNSDALARYRRFTIRTSSLGWAKLSCSRACSSSMSGSIRSGRSSDTFRSQRLLAAFDLEAIQLGRQFHHLLVDQMTGMQTPLAVEGVEAEIADQRPGPTQ
jgi:hypothetical protein